MVSNSANGGGALNSRSKTNPSLVPQNHDGDLNKLARKLMWQSFVFFFGLFYWVIFLLRALYAGTFFKKPTEKENNDFIIVRDAQWNLSKQPIPGFNHDFCKTRNGFQFHYLTNRLVPISGKDLVIFVHGFPNSCMVWRYLLREPALQNTDATFVAVDLPGYGGSDSLETYGTEVLEYLSEFIVMMREKYGTTGDSIGSTIVVGHDWGAAISLRLAVEASCLADRFVVTNGPLPELAIANIKRSVDSSSSIFKQFRVSPRQNFGCLAKAFQAIKPVLVQLLCSGYIFTFQLPAFLLKPLGQGGNLSFMRGAGKFEHVGSREEYKPQEVLSSNLGPSQAECHTRTKSGASYGPSVKERVQSVGEIFWQITGYYRHGLALDPWEKSIELIGALYNLDSDLSSSDSPSRRRSSSAASGLFSDQQKGCIRAPTTMLWAEDDIALTRAICVDGIGDYLGRDSEVFLLHKAAHWVPIGKASRQVLAQVLGMFASGDSKRTPSYIAKDIEALGINATLIAKK